MSNNPNLLLVEDDDFSAAVTIKMLGTDYSVQRVSSGEAALEAVAVQIPDLILLDVSMPGMSGYEVCRKLRNDATYDGMPIIFLSGLVSDEDCLAGFDAGGDDYLTKTVTPSELRTKINLSLENYAARRRFKGNISKTVASATCLADSHPKNDSPQSDERCPDYISVCREVIEEFKSLGMDARVRVYGQQGVISFNAEGPCSPLEESVLANQSLQKNLAEFGSNISCSQERITIIVKSAPQDDPRMKWKLALLARYADERVAALDSKAALAHLIESAKESLKYIERRHRDICAEESHIFHDLQRQLDLTLISFDISSSQRDELSELVKFAANRSIILCEDEHGRLQHLIKQLEGADNLMSA